MFNQSIIFYLYSGKSNSKVSQTLECSKRLCMIFASHSIKLLNHLYQDLHCVNLKIDINQSINKSTFICTASTASKNVSKHLICRQRQRQSNRCILDRQTDRQTRKPNSSRQAETTQTNWTNFPEFEQVPKLFALADLVQPARFSAPEVSRLQKGTLAFN